MVINKYLKTESRVVLIGKGAKSGGTSLLAKLDELIKKEKALSITLNFEESPMENTTIAYLSGLIEGVSMAVKDVIEVVVFLDEVTCLSDELSAMLVDSVQSWLENTDVSIVCTGHESTIIDMFESVTGNEYLNLVSCSGDYYKLVHETGKVISINQ